MDQSITSVTKSPYTPRVQSRTAKTPLVQSLKKSGRFSTSGRSLQLAQTILKSQSYNVERFGNTLPVIITEALTFADRNSAVSVRISECGYAWLVCGRRLLVWQYRQNVPGNQSVNVTPQRKMTSGTTQCYELTLPQSDLAHRADLVNVFNCPGSHMPSCIAVSPEGVIRYWPNVSHEGISVEITADLQGQECDSVCDVGRLGCVLATTTCTVVLIQPCLSAGGRHSLNCHTLRAPQGWFGAISKRMTSFIFGSMTHSDHSSETRLVRVLSVKQSDDQWWVYVLAGQMLQKWHMSATEPEQLLYITELGRTVRDAFQCTAWESCASDPTDMDIYLLDLQVVANSIMILAAAANLHISPQVQYALVRIDAVAPQPIAQIEEFLLLKLYGLFQENDTECLSYRILLCDSDIYIHKNRDITIIQSSNEPEVLDFSGVGDKLLGGSVCLNTPVFFSQNHGLVAVYSSDNTTPDMSRSFVDGVDASLNETTKINDLSMMSNLTLYSLEPEDMMTAHKDTLSQLKAAFIFYIKKEQLAYQEIINRLFPEEGEVKNEIDNILDKVIINISHELLDDAPAGDPRWTNDDKPVVGLGSSSAMQIQHQLQDKQQAHEIFLQFLQQSGLWARLSAVTVNNNLLATLHVLADHSELLIAAISIKNLMSMHGKLLQEVIDGLFKSDSKRGLTKQDLFFKDVTKVQKVVWGLVKKCEDESRSDINPIELINLITETNNVLMILFSAVMEFRQQKAPLFSPNPSVVNLHVKYIPWTYAQCQYCVYEALYKQQAITLNYGARVTTEGNSRACLYDQYVSIVDLLLDARKCNVESIRNTPSFDTMHRQYQTERHKLIEPLVIDKEWERAALLAEKYLDYTTLIVICENTNNQPRLDDYLERFKNDDFPQHVFNWYLQENKQGKLIARCKASIGPSSKSSLTKYLRMHPALSWLQHICENNYDQAAMTLKCLATEEKNLLTKKKTMLSIAKLANFVANGVSCEDEFSQNINKELELISYQEELPDTVLSSFGYDTIRQPVLEPEKLAQLYICDEHFEVSEYDYVKALEISSFTTNEEMRIALVLRVWSSAILRDQWNYQEQLSPLEFLQKTLFYKVADLAITIGKHPNEVLPPIEVLLDSALLEDLKTDTHFQYLIKLGYDYFYRSQENDES